LDLATGNCEDSRGSEYNRGTGCGNTARPGLCGGRPVTGVPTVREETIMSEWYSKDLGDGVQAFAPSGQILEAFIPAFAAAGQPIEMAVYSRYDLKANVVTVYFSPAAASLAKTFDATSCEKPSFERLGLLVGDQRSVGILFPETQR